MNGKETKFSMRDLQRYETIRASLDGRLTVRQAAEALGLSQRQVLTLRHRVIEQGAAGVLHGNKGREPVNKTSPQVRNAVLDLAQTVYAGFNFSHLADLLAEEHDIHRSDETLRLWLRPLGIGSAPRKAKKHRRRRKRKDQEGDMLFLDGSPHPWFGDESPPVCLILCSDDATGKPLFGLFTDHENRDDVFRVSFEVFRKFGLPVRFYLDRASWAKVSRHRPEDASEKTPRLTHFEIAMRTLRVNVLHAHSPQARGRGERLNGSFQNRLVAELALHGIRNVRAATRYLNDRFIPRYVRWFAKTPANPTPAWRPIPKGIDLQRVLCAKANRTVANDNTISYEGQAFQLIPPRHLLHLVRAKIEVQRWFDGSVHFVHPRVGEVRGIPVEPAAAQPMIASAHAL